MSVRSRRTACVESESTARRRLHALIDDPRLSLEYVLALTLYASALIATPIPDDDLWQDESPHLTLISRRHDR